LIENEKLRFVLHAVETDPELLEKYRTSCSESLVLNARGGIVDDNDDTDKEKQYLPFEHATGR
jgi:hypothetical protein